jgi:hypothetical protein
MPFFSGAPPLQYELLSLLLIVGFFVFPFLTSSSQPFYLALYLLLSSFSSAWAAVSDLNLSTPKFLSRFGLSNRDAHDADTLALFAILRYKSWGVLFQVFARHCQVISGGKLLSSDFCSPIRKLLAQPTVRFVFVLLEFFTVLELAILVLWRRSLASILCFFVWIGVQSSFQYAVREPERQLWQELYRVIAEDTVRASVGKRLVLGVVLWVADRIAEMATAMWPVKPKVWPSGSPSNRRG